VHREGGAELGAAPAPFFRFPGLQHTPASVDYLGSRNIAIFSCDVDSFDFRAKDPAQIVNTVMTARKRQGIILMLITETPLQPCPRCCGG
jgi:hypothetical protein